MLCAQSKLHTTTTTTKIDTRTAANETTNNMDSIDLVTQQMQQLELTIINLKQQQAQDLLNKKFNDLKKQCQNETAQYKRNTSAPKQAVVDHDNNNKYAKLRRWMHVEQLYLIEHTATGQMNSEHAQHLIEHIDDSKPLMFYHRSVQSVKAKYWRMQKHNITHKTLTAKTNVNLWGYHLNCLDFVWYFVTSKKHQDVSSITQQLIACLFVTADTNTNTNFNTLSAQEILWLRSRSKNQILQQITKLLDCCN